MTTWPTTANTTTPHDEVHPLDRVFMDVDPRWAAGRDYMPAVVIDVKKRAWQRMVYDLNQRMSRE